MTEIYKSSVGMLSRTIYATVAVGDTWGSHRDREHQIKHLLYLQRPAARWTHQSLG